MKLFSTFTAVVVMCMTFAGCPMRQTTVSLAEIPDTTNYDSVMAAFECDVKTLTSQITADQMQINRLEVVYDGLEIKQKAAAIRRDTIKQSTTSPNIGSRRDDY